VLEEQDNKATTIHSEYYPLLLLEMVSDFISVRIKEKIGLIAVMAVGKLARPAAIFNTSLISHR